MYLSVHLEILPSELSAEHPWTAARGSEPSLSCLPRLSGQGLDSETGSHYVTVSATKTSNEDTENSTVYKESTHDKVSQGCFSPPE